MRTGTRKESVESRGSTSWNDGLHPFDGTGLSSGSLTKAEDSGLGTGGSGGEGKAPIGQTTWFAPVTEEQIKDCPGGVCPVPWATIEPTIEQAPVLQGDTVNHPPHYTDGGVECIEAIEAQQTLEEFRGYLKGNIAKYLWREKHKGGTESLKKAQWYLDRLIQLDEAQKG